jgi:hypothetical protein
MKKAKTEMKSQSFTCSNPECGRVFDDPIIVQDFSSKNGSSYSACPYCLTEIVIEKTSEVEEEKRTLKKKRAIIKKAKAQPPKLKPAEPLSLKENKCPYHFGYLSQRSRKEEIPEECMTCEKIVQCMLKKVTG